MTCSRKLWFQNRKHQQVVLLELQELKKINVRIKGIKQNSKFICILQKTFILYKQRSLT